MSKTRRNNGITLVEVVVSIGLLAMLLVTTLSIRGRHIRQIRRAKEIQNAVAATDQQIALWYESKDGIPANATGVFASLDSCSWRTSLLPAVGTNQKWGAVKVRVEAISARTSEVLVAVELLGSPKDQKGGA